MNRWVCAANWRGEQILRVAIPGEDLFIPYEDCALITAEMPDFIKAEYGAYLLLSSFHNIIGQSSIIGEDERRFCVLPEDCPLYAGRFVHIAADGQLATIRLLHACDLPDRTLFFTGRCNSDCVMCPYTTKWREKAESTPIRTLLRYVELMNPNAPYLCITGGEPTLSADDFILLLDRMKSRFSGTLIHVLTNGRAFGDSGFLSAFIKARPRRTLLGIPLYAHTPALHDEITNTPGSFTETVEGLDRLYTAGEHVELRVVLTAFNLPYLIDLAEWICERYPRIYMVSLMGMEMMGNAYVNRARVWASYETIMPVLSATAEALVRGGVQTQIYNMPLCKVDRRCWPLCRKSISAEKIAFPVECDSCAVRDACGGFFKTNLYIPGVQAIPIGE